MEHFELFLLDGDSDEAPLIDRLVIRLTPLGRQENKEIFSVDGIQRLNPFKSTFQLWKKEYNKMSSCCDEGLQIDILFPSSPSFLEQAKFDLDKQQSDSVYCGCEKPILLRRCVECNEDYGIKIENEKAARVLAKWVCIRNRLDNLDLRKARGPVTIYQLTGEFFALLGKKQHYWSRSSSKRPGFRLIKSTGFTQEERIGLRDYLVAYLMNERRHYEIFLATSPDASDSREHASRVSGIVYLNKLLSGPGLSAHSKLKDRVASDEIANLENIASFAFKMGITVQRVKNRYSGSDVFSTIYKDLDLWVYTGPLWMLEIIEKILELGLDIQYSSLCQEKKEENFCPVNSICVVPGTNEARIRRTGAMNPDDIPAQIDSLIHQFDGCGWLKRPCKDYLDSFRKPEQDSDLTVTRAYGGNVRSIGNFIKITTGLVSGASHSVSNSNVLHMA